MFKLQEQQVGRWVDTDTPTVVGSTFFESIHKEKKVLDIIKGKAMEGLPD